MISVRFTMVSGKTWEFRNVQSTMEALGLKCGGDNNIVIKGSNGRMIALIGRHIESLEELPSVE